MFKDPLWTDGSFEDNTAANFFLCEGMMPPSLCAKCGQLVGSNETQCSQCGTRKTERARPTRGLDLFPLYIIQGLCVLLYVISILMNTDAALNPKGGLLSIGSPDGKALYLLGMTGGYAWKQGYWWTLLSASFLHGGILHIFFNLSWLTTLGKIFGQLFGMYRLVVLYVFTGITGFLLSNLMHNAPTIGASCSIFGIMGALITFSLRRGGEFGRSLRSQVWAWVIIGLVFGFVVEGVNNYGHIGGLLGGFALGMVLPAREGVAEESWMPALAYVLLALSIAGVGLSFSSFWSVYQLNIPAY